MTEDPTNIQKLLRLKRYEQPPEGYFDDFLVEFQRRQRAEILRRPKWQIFFDRISEWFEETRVPKMAYAGIIAAGIAVAAVMVGPSDESGSSAGLASVESRADLDAAFAGNNNEGSAALPSSYVLETRPVSYEAPFSF